MNDTEDYQNERLIKKIDCKATDQISTTASSIITIVEFDVTQIINPVDWLSYESFYIITVSPKKIKVNQKWANSTKIVTSTTTQNALMEICAHLDTNHWQFTNLLFASFGCKEIVQK